MGNFFKYTDPDEKNRKLTKLQKVFNSFSGAYGKARTATKVSFKALKYSFNIASITFVAAASLYVMPEQWLPQDDNKITSSINSYKDAIRGYAETMKDKSLKRLNIAPEFNITDNNLSQARRLAESNRERLHPYAKDSGLEGAKIIFKDTNMSWDKMCLGVNELNTIDNADITKGQKELYDALMVLKMSPTARYLIQFAEDKDLYLCYQNLGELVNGNYQNFLYTINIDNLNLKTIAHELGHHWQAEHNLLFTNRDDLSYEQAYAMELSIESAAKVIGALVDKEIALAREHGGEGYQASFQDIIKWEGLMNLREFMAEEYKTWFNNEAWLNFYGDQFDRNKQNKALPLNSSESKDKQLRSLDIPMIGYALDYGSYMTQETIDKTLSTAQEEIQKRDASKPRLNN
jgi:hypothetical protein